MMAFDLTCPKCGYQEDRDKDRLHGRIHVAEVKGSVLMGTDTTAEHVLMICRACQFRWKEEVK